jgi:hypothetical protein
MRAGRSTLPKLQHAPRLRSPAHGGIAKNESPEYLLRRRTGDDLSCVPRRWSVIASATPSSKPVSSGFLPEDTGTSVFAGAAKGSGCNAMSTVAIVACVAALSSPD